MAANWIYYPQDPLVESATLTVTAGTCANIANATNNRRLSLIDITVLGSYISGSDEFMFRIDKGSASVNDFIALVNNNLYTDTGKVAVYYDDFDNSALADPSLTLTQQTAVSTDEPIWVEAFASTPNKRYLWVNLDTISTSAEFGCLLIGTILNPSIDPNLESAIEIDIESGRIVNRTPGGVNWKTRTHGTRKGWEVNYELISTTDKDLILNGLFADTVVDIPFVFTDDGGTTYHYGEMIGNPQIVKVQEGLWNLSFTIGEVIA